MGVSQRKEREKQQMQSLILDTARRLFIHEGFDKVTIRRIAEEIEYSPGSIYSYFEDKDAIFYTLYLKGFAILHELQQKTAEIADPLERLREILGLYIRFGLEQPEYYDLMFIMRSPLKKFEGSQGWELGLKTYRFFEDTVQACVEQKMLRAVSAKHFGFALWTMGHGMISLVIRKRTAIFSFAELKDLVDESVEMILENFVL